MKTFFFLLMLFTSLTGGHAGSTSEYLISDYFYHLERCHAIALNTSIFYDFPPSQAELRDETIEIAVCDYLRRVNTNASRILMRHLHFGIVKVTL